MNDRDIDLMLRAIEGRLSTDECSEFDRRVADEPTFRNALEDLRGLQGALNDDAVRTFSPRFVESVMSALDLATQAARLDEWIAWSFLRIAVAAAIIAVSITAYNLSIDGSLLSIPSVNLATANTPNMVEFP